MSGSADTCRLCGGRPDATVSRRWSTVIGMDAPLQNNRAVNAGPARWRYKKERSAWESSLQFAMVVGGVPKATGRRRVTIERRYSGQQRVCDIPNLVGGCKTVLDAMVRVGLLVDDSPEHFEGYFHQRRVEKHERGTLITIEELA